MHKGGRRKRGKATGDAADNFMSEPVDRQAAVAAIVAKVRAACEKQPCHYTLPIDIDRVVVTSVNVPFPHGIDAAMLAGALVTNTVPDGFAGHIARFLGEVPMRDVLRFCDHHGLPAGVLARYVETHGKRLEHRA